MLESSIKEYFVIVQLWGLETQPDFRLPIYGGHLFRSPEMSNNPNFSVLRELEKELHKEQPRNLYGIVFYEFKAIGEEDNVRQLAIDRAEFVINILRLYLASAVDKHRRATPPELRLTHIANVPIDRVYIQAIDADALPTIYGRPRHTEPYLAGNSRMFIDSLNSKGFAELNSLLETSTEQSQEMVGRLREAILWFSRGIASEEMADSFLFCAISAESLVSMGLNSQDDFALCIARLVVNVIDERPAIKAFFSQRFLEQVNQIDQQERVPFLRARAVELFALRNHIAHGIYRTRNILDELSDIEDLVRGTIFAVANGPWETLRELRRWVHGNSP